MPNSKSWIPPVEFYFQVDFQKPGGPNFRASFLEVSGLGWSFGVRKKSDNEGGQQSIPTRISYNNVTFKRPVGPLSASFGKWVNNCFNYMLFKHAKEDMKKIEAYDVIIKLLDKEGAPVAAWACYHAYPVKYTVGGFNSQNSGLAIETVDLAFNRLERIN